MYLLNKLSNNSFSLTISGYSTTSAIALNISKVAPYTHVFSDISFTSSPVPDVAYNSSLGIACYYTDGTYVITLEEGVYKMSIDEAYNSVVGGSPVFTIIHFFVSKNTTYDIFTQYINDLLCCNAKYLCRCKSRCEDYYDITNLGLLSASFLGEPDIDIMINFAPVTSSHNLFVKDIEYYCTTGTTGGVFLITTNYCLRDDSYNFVSNTVVEGEYYTCTLTGSVTSVAASVLDPINDRFLEKLYYIADCLERVTKYVDGCDISKPCSCS